ncbi:MAG: hypothetical protein ACJA0X_000156 [Cyclobacteriaceae bacterium]|jgi:hypothetical protein
MKFIKNNILIFALIGVMFSCDPLDETYEELDGLKEAAGEDAGLSIRFSLVDEDYASFASTLRSNKTVEDSAKADFIDQYTAFNASISVDALLGDLVNEKYPQLRKGAAVRVTYNMLEGETFTDGSTKYVSALTYSLDADDYAGVSSEAGLFGFFDGDVNYMAEISSILSTAIQSPSSGDIVAVSFDKIDAVYSSLTGETVYAEPFESNIDGFTAFDLEGEQGWGHGEGFGSTYAIMSGFSGSQQANKDWLVSPEIDLSDKKGSITLKMSQILNFQGAAVWGTNLRIVFANDYTGDVATATWQDLAFDALPVGNNWDVFDNQSDLSAAAGESIHIAFYYESTTDDAPNWRLTNLSIDAGAAPETDEVNVFYEYDDSEWVSVSDEAYFMGSADYDAMGEGSGQPGRFNNFSSNTPPEAYIPSFLSDVFPFAQDGDEYVVAYKYFSGSTSTRGNVYVYESGMWTASSYDEQIIDRTDQYVHTGTEFVFNPSVTMTMVSSDFQIIVDEVVKTRPDLVSSFGTGEDLYGADAFFVNFDTRLSSRLEEDESGNPLQPEYIGLSADESTALIAQRVTEGIDIFLEAKFSDVQPIAGIEILYTVSYVTFDGTGGSGTEVFILTGLGAFEPQ